MFNNYYIAQLIICMYALCIVKYTVLPRLKGSGKQQRRYRN